MRSAEGRSKSNRNDNSNNKSKNNNNRKGNCKSMAIYHLTASVGSRSTGQSAAAKYAYISREGRYQEERHDVENRELLYTESDMMPAWAADNPALYWKSADLYERANGRLFQQVEFALPRELSREEQIELAREFAMEVTNTKNGFLPYTLAVHAGKGENPHAHLMMSERVHDGHERTPETWFKRAATSDKAPELGGAKKTVAFQGREWIDQVREQWAGRANLALETAGREERIDHRSHAERGFQQIPTVHEGPNVRQMHARGLPGATVELNNEIRAVNAELSRFDRVIEKIQSVAEKIRESAFVQNVERGIASVNDLFKLWQQDQQRQKQAQEHKLALERERSLKRGLGFDRGHGFSR